MKTIIRSFKKSQPLILFILFGGMIFSSCSLVGAMGGLAIDSSNRKKKDKIQTESQKITIQYTDGKTVRGVYKGLAYAPLTTVASDSLHTDQQVLFPQIGENISLILRGDTVSQKGIFSGLAKTKTEYYLFLRAEPNQPVEDIAFKELERITTENGRILSSIPDPGRIYLLCEVNGETQRIPLDSLNHINNKNTRNALYLGVAGLAIDAIVIISVSQSLSDMTLDW